MKLGKLFTDDDAVSPVIGVILMVAITVILAAVIGAFVLNIGGSQESAPQATLQWENTSSGVEVTHQSGEALPGSEIELQTDATPTSNWPDTSTTLEAGDTSIVATGASSGDEVKIIWNSPSSDKSSIIASYTV